MNIIERQTFVISVNFSTMTGLIPSQAQLPIQLKFAADELVLKSIIYNNTGAGAVADVDDVIQIWCNLTNDNLIGAFPNTPTQGQVCLVFDQHFRLNNNFQNGELLLQFQGTDGSIYDDPPNPTLFGSPVSINPQRLISLQDPQRTHGTAVITIQFVKYMK